MRHHLCFLVFLIAVVLSTASLPIHAETWFEEAKRIRQEADHSEARSQTFEILPDCELTEKSVKAGATFKNHGERVIVRHALIRVELPVAKGTGNGTYKYRAREVSYNGEPAWTGRWRDAWALGNFNYTVTATYKGNVYTKQFRVGRDGVIASR